VQKAALVYGIVFVIGGVGGFTPGRTTDIDSLKLAGA
jgi:hypothetical protein